MNSFWVERKLRCLCIFALAGILVSCGGSGGGPTRVDTGSSGPSATAQRVVSSPGPTLEVTVQNASGGTVVSSPSGIVCGTACFAAYNAGTLISLTAVPNTGYVFTGWYGACSGTSTCTVTASGAQTVSAGFDTATSAILNVSIAGQGTGSVSSVPSGISCGQYCTATYGQGTSITLAATPSTNSVFSGWSGACSGVSSCVVSMSSNQTVTANFSPLSNPPPTSTLSLTVSGPGSGSVVSVPSGINCSTSCSDSFTTSTQVTLTATASSGSVFTGWDSSACAGTDPCTVILTSDTSVGAAFNQAFPVTVAFTGSGAGSVTSLPPGISCGPVCTAYFPVGTLVGLLPSPQSGSVLTTWTGACSGNGGCSFTVSGPVTANAQFDTSRQSATPLIEITPTSLAFGNIAINTSTTQTLDIANVGNANLVVSGATIVGTGFSVPPFQTPVTIAPGSGIPYVVTFAPASSGSFTGSLTFTTTAANSFAPINLSGSAVVPIPHSVILSWMASLSNVTGYKVYRGTTSGGPYTLLTSNPITSTSYTDNTVTSGLTYFYVVTSVNGSSESGYSNEANAIIPLP
jgi:uncharacterized repeat protein (TIGR02543 family)